MGEEEQVWDGFYSKGMFLGVDFLGGWFCRLLLGVGGGGGFFLVYLYVVGVCDLLVSHCVFVDPFDVTKF